MEYYNLGTSYVCFCSLSGQKQTSETLSDGAVVREGEERTQEEWSATDTSVWQKVGRVNIKDYSIYAVMSNGVFADFQIMRIFNGDIFSLYSTGIGTGFDTGTTTATIIA